MGNIRRKKGRLVSVQLDTDHVAEEEIAAFLQINDELGMTVLGTPRRGLLPEFDREADREEGVRGAEERVENLGIPERNRHIRALYKQDRAVSDRTENETVAMLARRNDLSERQIDRILGDIRQVRRRARRPK
jgi:hypothetical protein